VQEAVEDVEDYFYLVNVSILKKKNSSDMEDPKQIQGYRIKIQD